MYQTDDIEDEVRKKEVIAELFHELGSIQNEIFAASIESIDIGTQIVTEKSYIEEWLTNCDRSIFEAIKNQFNKNKESWRIPSVTAKCMSCDHEFKIAIDLDQSSFFGNA